MDSGIDKKIADDSKREVQEELEAKAAVKRNNLHDAQKEVLNALQSTIRACSYFDPMASSDPIVLFLYRAASQLRSASDKIEELLK